MKGYVFDLDGTIYVDEHVIDGVPEAISRLKKRGDKVVFLTNKSISRRSDYVRKLNDLGIQVELEEVISSNYITALYLKSVLQPEEKVMCIGEEPLLDELREQGIQLTDQPNGVSYVVLGWDREFTYKKINNAYQAWKNGAKIVATNPDRTCPVQGGEIPDCAAMIGALEAVTGESVFQVTGKPSQLTAQYVLKEVLKMPVDQCFMIGDRLETDIKMGNEAGMSSVLVMTGITTKELLEDSIHKPKHILDSVKYIDQL
ncbi:HAD-IIA family hydrolase [Bacillus sp. FJAT-49705]|uniref:Acid sugar phosphatase n=1 Tax=Cytobacillus citreus TaxID=2833586 RepID=A0ABS5NZJ8_9BACI|nr:HAD-IIA family hydrolase [Cytobacillus citreus]